MQYLYETHCHTDEASNCGKVPALETARMYKEAGYAGIVITDHFNRYTFDSNGASEWDEMVDFSMRGYNIAKTLEDDSFKVFYGQEIRFEKDSDNDYLCFGMTEEYLRAHPYIMDIDDYDDFYKLVHADGIVVYQAHPFRNNIKAVNPKYLDGIEVFNGNKRHDSRCEIAMSWAVKYGLRFLSGSDFHQYEDFARGGIITDKKLETVGDLANTLLNNDYSIKWSFDYKTKE